jgi:prepilin signal peptidase PulO-like enzyme (type II secretory pathway)
MREKKVEIDTHIPFGPFLAFGMYAALLYWDQIKALFEIHL